MRVGWDLDGVDYAFSDSVLRWFEIEGLHATDVQGKDPDSWHFYEKWGLTDEEFRRHVDAGVDAGVIFGGPAREKSAFAHWKVKMAGHSIHIITHRHQGSPGNAQRNTLKWLSENYILYDTIDFSEDKTIVPTDIFIEDKIENYDALEAAGVESWLVNRPWNTKAPDGRRRVDSVLDFAIMVSERKFATR